MFNDKTLNQARQGKEKWSKEVKENSNEFQQERRFSTISDLDIKPIYTPEDIKDLDFDSGIGYPGIYPFTRAVNLLAIVGKHGRFECSPASEVPGIPIKGGTSY